MSLCLESTYPFQRDCIYFCVCKVSHYMGQDLYIHKVRFKPTQGFPSQITHSKSIRIFSLCTQTIKLSECNANQSVVLCVLQYLARSTRSRLSNTWMDMAILKYKQMVRSAWWFSVNESKYDDLRKHILFSFWHTHADISLALIWVNLMARGVKN